MINAKEKTWLEERERRDKEFQRIEIEAASRLEHDPQHLAMIKAQKEQAKTEERLYKARQRDMERWSISNAMRDLESQLKEIDDQQAAAEREEAAEIEAATQE